MDTYDAIKAQELTEKLHRQLTPIDTMTPSRTSSYSSASSAAVEHHRLRRVRDKLPLRLWIVASISFWEKASFWSLTAPWQNYMQNPPRTTDEGTPGALGLGQVKATRIYCGFYICYYVAPMIFAVLSDWKLGRYRTLLLCLILFNIGCAVITVSSIPSLLGAGWGLPGLIVSMVCVALGGGGFESNMAAFLADQYSEIRPRIITLDSGERLITDRNLTVEYIYNLNYWLGNVGSLFWFAIVVIEDRVGFTMAYGLTFVFIFISLITLVIGKPKLLRATQESQILAQSSKVLLCAAQNRFKLSRADPKYQLEQRRKVVPWSSKLVDELRRVLQGCRILLAFVMFYICFDQMQNNLISQAAQMKTGRTPNDMLSAMNQVGCIVFTPLIQHVIYPLLHQRHIYIKPITRITVGFVFVALAMVYAAVLQNAIYSTGPCYNHPRDCKSAVEHEPNSINVWYQAPVFFLIAMGEVWAYVTGLEIAYSYAPKHMKSMVQAVFPLMAGTGSAFAMGISPFAHDPYLVIFYSSLAGGMTLVTVVFWLVFRKHDQKGEETSHDSHDIHDGADQSPSSGNNQGRGVMRGLDLGAENVDVELGPLSLKRATNHLNLTGTTIATQGSHDLSIEPEGTGVGGTVTAPHAAMLVATHGVGGPKGGSPAQDAVSPSLRLHEEGQSLSLQESGSNLITRSSGSTEALAIQPVLPPMPAWI